MFFNLSRRRTLVIYGVVLSPFLHLAVKNIRFLCCNNAPPPARRPIFLALGENFLRQLLTRWDVEWNILYCFSLGTMKKSRIESFRLYFCHAGWVRGGWLWRTQLLLKIAIFH
jgi:hypothetical protein